MAFHFRKRVKGRLKGGVKKDGKKSQQETSGGDKMDEDAPDSFGSQGGAEAGALWENLTSSDACMKRELFASWLWHHGAVQDAIICAAYLNRATAAEAVNMPETHTPTLANFEEGGSLVSVENLVLDLPVVYRESMQVFRFGHVLSWCSAGAPAPCWRCFYCAPQVATTCANCGAAVTGKDCASASEDLAVVALAASDGLEYTRVAVPLPSIVRSTSQVPKVLTSLGEVWSSAAYLQRSQARKGDMFAPTLSLVEQPKESLLLLKVVPAFSPQMATAPMPEAAEDMGNLQPVEFKDSDDIFMANAARFDTHSVLDRAMSHEYSGRDAVRALPALRRSMSVAAESTRVPLPAGEHAAPDAAAHLQSGLEWRPSAGLARLLYVSREARKNPEGASSVRQVKDFLDCRVSEKLLMRELHEMQCQVAAKVHALEALLEMLLTATSSSALYDALWFISRLTSSSEHPSVPSAHNGMFVPSGSFLTAPWLPVGVVHRLRSQLHDILDAVLRLLANSPDTRLVRIASRCFAFPVVEEDFPFLQSSGIFSVISGLLASKPDSPVAAVEDPRSPAVGLLQGWCLYACRNISPCAPHCRYLPRPPPFFSFIPSPSLPHCHTDCICLFAWLTHAMSPSPMSVMCAYRGMPFVGPQVFFRRPWWSPCRPGPPCWPA